MNIENIKKKRELEKYLENDHVLVHLNSSLEKVVVPENCMNNPILTLKISKLFYGHLEVSEDGISTSLKFSGQYSDCFIPWDAVWGISSDTGEQKIWEKFLPEELKRSDVNEVNQKSPVVVKKEAEDTTERNVQSLGNHLKRIK